MTLLLVLESVELAARVDDLEVPFRSIAPVVVILPLRVLAPVPESVRLLRAVDAPTVPRLIAPEPLEIAKV